MKRLFTAITIQPEEKLLNAYQYIKNTLSDDKIKWVKDDKFHITLKFLGDTPNKQVSDVAELLEKSLEDTQSFNFLVTGFGYFGNSRFPRVLWLGTKHTKNLQNIQKKVSLALKDFGLPENNPDFKPHLTIGRVKEFNSMDELFELEASLKDEVFQTVEVKEVMLYESFLKPDGPVYKVIKKVDLK